jgi:hypothetical protein
MPNARKEPLGTLSKQEMYGRQADPGVGKDGNSSAIGDFQFL